MEATATTNLYLAGHIQGALAMDERTNMLDIAVKVEGDCVFLSGNATCWARRLLAEQVARELVPDGIRVVNGICVENYQQPVESESLS